MVLYAPFFIFGLGEKMDLIPEHYAVMLFDYESASLWRAQSATSGRERVPRRHGAFKRQPRESFAHVFSRDVYYKLRLDI